jgi:hypothetical protein
MMKKMLGYVLLRTENNRNHRMIRRAEEAGNTLRSRKNIRILQKRGRVSSGHSE